MVRRALSLGKSYHQVDVAVILATAGAVQAVKYHRTQCRAESGGCHHVSFGGNEQSIAILSIESDIEILSRNPLLNYSVTALLWSPEYRLMGR